MHRYLWWVLWIAFHGVYGLTIFNQRTNDIIKSFDFFFGSINACSGLNKNSFVFFVSSCGTIIVLIKTTATLLWTSVANIRSFLCFWAWVIKWNKVFAKVMAFVTSLTFPFVIEFGTANMFLVTVLGKSTTKGLLIELVMFLKSPMFLYLFRDSSRILT